MKTDIQKILDYLDGEKKLLENKIDTISINYEPKDKEQQIRNYAKLETLSQVKSFIEKECVEDGRDKETA